MHILDDIGIKRNMFVTIARFIHCNYPEQSDIQFQYHDNSSLYGALLVKVQINGEGTN